MTTATTNSITSEDGSVQSTVNPMLTQIQQRLGYLEEALVAQDPKIKQHLLEIHKLMISHEELVHLLKPEEIAKIMQGQQAVTNTVLAAVAKKPAAKSKTASMTVMDL